MKNKDLIKHLKALPEESEVFYDDLQGGLLEISSVELYPERKLREIQRPDVKSPAIVLSDTSLKDTALR